MTETHSHEELDRFVEKMGQSGPEAEEFFARRRKLGLGVGLDATGNLVRQKKLRRRKNRHDKIRAAVETVD